MWLGVPLHLHYPTYLPTIILLVDSILACSTSCMYNFLLNGLPHSSLTHSYIQQSATTTHYSRQLENVLVRPHHHDHKTTKTTTTSTTTSSEITTSNKIFTYAPPLVEAIMLEKKNPCFIASCHVTSLSSRWHTFKSSKQKKSEDWRQYGWQCMHSRVVQYWLQYLLYLLYFLYALFACRCDDVQYVWCIVWPPTRPP